MIDTTSHLRIGVVGASGFVGSAIAHDLEARGHLVTSLSAPRLRVSPPESVEGVAVLGRALIGAFSGLRLRRFDVVVCAAGDPRATSTGQGLRQANALLPVGLYLACAAAGVSRFVHISSAAVQGASALDETPRVRPFSEYSRSKALGEMALRRIAVPQCRLVIYRPTGVHDKGREVTEKLVRYARSRYAVVAAADQATPQILRRNMASAVTFICEHPSPPQIVTHPEDPEMTTARLLERLGGHKPLILPPVVSAVASQLIRHIPGGHARRAQVLLFGQENRASWLLKNQWRPPLGVDAWEKLTDDAGQDASRTVVFGVTASLQIPYLGNTPTYFSKKGWDVHVVSAPGPEQDDLCGLHAHGIPMERNPSALRDLIALSRWVALLRTIRPGVVFSGTPKAALLSLIAARIVNVPIRVYLLRGLRLETERGLRRNLLWILERMAIRSSTEVVAISPSLLTEARSLGLLSSGEGRVVGAGSSHGVDLDRFNKQAVREHRDVTRQQLRLPTDGFVVGYAGRIRRDKGVVDLLDALKLDVEENIDAVLLVGRIEEPAIFAMLQQAALHGRVIHVPHTDAVERIMAAMDVLCLPSHREGFGNVIVEAGAMGIPAVASDATGVRDAVVAEETGLRFRAGNPADLLASLLRMRDAELRTRLGDRAAAHVRAEYDANKVDAAYEAYCTDLVNRICRPS